MVLHTAQLGVQLQSAWRRGKHIAFHAAQRLPISGQRHSQALCSLRREVPTELKGQAPLLTRQPHSDFLLVRFSHNTMPAEALLHGKVLPQPACSHTKGALLLMERENMTLEVEHSSVGVAAAFQRTPAHVVLGRASSCAASGSPCP